MIFDRHELEKRQYTAIGRPLLRQSRRVLAHDPLAAHRSTVEHDPVAVAESYAAITAQV